MVEINCETDFVAKDASFLAFAEAVAETALAGSARTAEQLAAEPLASDPATTVDAAREALIAKIGENIQVRRLLRFDGVEGALHSYRHGVRIGVVVELTGGDESLGRDIAMHIAATNPLCVSADQVPADTLAKEREIFKAQALESGKPEAIVDKMIEGRMRKYLEEVTLLGQPFVKDPDQTVEKRLKQAGAGCAALRGSRSARASRRRPRTSPKKSWRRFAVTDSLRYPAAPSEHVATR